MSFHCNNIVTELALQVCTELHVFNRLLEDGCLQPKPIAGVLQIQSCVVVQSEYVSLYN
jgi:hypothetical protein